MFKKLRQSFNRLRKDPDVEELCANTAHMLRHEMRRLAQKAKRRSEVQIESFNAASRS